MAVVFCYYFLLHHLCGFHMGLVQSRSNTQFPSHSSYNIQYFYILVHYIHVSHQASSQFMLFIVAQYNTRCVTSFGIKSQSGLHKICFKTCKKRTTSFKGSKSKKTRYITVKTKNFWKFSCLRRTENLFETKWGWVVSHSLPLKKKELQ